MRKTHLLLTSLLIVLLCSGTHADSGKVSLVRDLSGTMQDIQILLEDVREHSAEGASFTAGREALQSLLTDLRAGHLLLTERFRQQGRLAMAAGDRVAERQRRMSERSAQLVGELLALLERFAGPEQVNAPEIDRALVLLAQLLQKPQPPLHGVLPYRSLEVVDVPLQQQPVIVPAYQLAAVAATASDLQPVPEAPLSALITDQAREIAFQAGKINWDPVDLYQWVKNNIATEWYRGCMKGAEETLRQRRGNDADQAALLVALLRAAGFPARYVRGVIEFFPGLSSLQQLTGIDDPVRIGAFLNKAGIPCQPVMDGAAIVNYRVEHVWVEALLPYANYRGAMGDANGRTWLPLDTSIKVAGFVEQGSVDLYAAEGPRLDDLVTSYLAASQGLTPLERVRSVADDFLAGQAPLVTYPDLLHVRQQNSESLGIISPEPQFLVKVVTGEYPALPPELVHTARFRIGGDDPLLDIRLPVYALSNRKIVISFEPESVADHETINLWGGLDNTPAYLVRLRPVLLVDGQRMIVGSQGFVPGEGFDLTITLTSPSLSQETINRVITGYPLQIGLVAQEVIPPAENPQPLATDLLQRAALDYIERWNRAERELAELLFLQIARPLPHLVSMGGQLDVVALLGEPQEISLQGLFLDADLRVVATMPRSGSVDHRERLFMQLSALHGAVLEERLFPDNFAIGAISTATLFGLAGDRQVPILTLDAANVETTVDLLPVADNIKSDIRAATARGWTVRIPAQPLDHADWQGIGYIKEDPLSGAAGYMLSGMTAGGSTVTRTEAWSDLLKYLFKYPLSLPPNADPDAAYTISKISVTDLQDGIVGQPLAEPLTVYVRDSAGVPVRNASVTFTVQAGGGHLVDDALDPPVQGQSVTVPTDWRGLARVSLVAGQSTADNTISWHTDGDLYATWASRQTVAASLANGTGLTQPFAATALPEAPHQLAALTAGSTGSILQFAGKVGAAVTDSYGNPVANVPVRFSTAAPTPHLGLCDPAAANPAASLAQLTTERACMDQVPSWGECAVSGDVTGLSMSNGVVSAGVVLGSAPDGVYPVTAAYAGPSLATPLETVRFLNYSATLPDSPCGGNAPPLNYLTLQQEEYPVRPAGKPVVLKVKAQMFAEGVSAGLGSESLSCGEIAQSCPQVAGNGSFVRITPASLQVSIAGQPAVLSNEAPDLYEAQLSLALGEQLIPVSALATRSVTLFDNRCAASGGCAPLPTLQAREFPADWQVAYTGVAIGGLPDLLRLEVDAEGSLLQDTPISFAILPAGYEAVSASFLIYQDGWLVLSMPTATSGAPSVTLPQGFRFDPGSHYELAVVLNHGWGAAEIWSERVPFVGTEFAVRLEGVPGTWLSAGELQKAGGFVLLNNDLERTTAIADDDELKQVNLLLPPVGGAVQGSWSISLSDAQHLLLRDSAGAELVPGQAYPVALPASINLYLEGLAESTALQADAFTVRFVPEGCAALEKTLPLTVVKFDMAADGNRNRFLDFEKFEDEESLFWINNDYDDSTCVDVATTPESCEEDDLNIGLEDARDNRIRTKRDLEDFARLHVVLGANLPEGTLSFSARIEGVANEPAPVINLFRAVDSTDKYLGFELGPDDHQPDLQLLEERLAILGPQVTPLAPAWLPPGQLSAFLFEGLSAGRGSLILTASRLGVPVVEKRIQLDLQEVTYFYDHFSLAASGDDLPPVATTLSMAREGGYRPDLAEYVLFVHGWNTEDWLKRRWAETIVKRLWWHGYQGKVGLFDWPCRTLPSLDFQVNFDHSEHRAWHAAALLAGLLTDPDRSIGGRSAGQVRILAHSQGNVVTGEAINLAPAGTVHSYVASQAALSSSFYHQDWLELVPQLPSFDYATPDVFGFYPEAPLLAPYLDQVPQKVRNGNLFSYFNEKDYALTTAGAILPAWEYNNTTRPDNSIGYNYAGSVDVYPDPLLDGEGFVKRDYETDPLTGEITLISTRDLHFPEDRYEIFSYGAQSRAKALGAVHTPPGFSPDSKDLSALFGFDEKAYAHSRQFRSNIIDEMGYWSAFVDDTDLTLLGAAQEF